MAKFTVSRSKGGVVHWATAFAKAGNVTKWSTKKDEAATITEEFADSVGAFYKKAKDCGTIAVHDEKGKAVAKLDTPSTVKPVPKADPNKTGAELAALKAERDEFQKQAATAGENYENLLLEFNKLKAERDELAELVKTAK